MRKSNLYDRGLANQYDSDGLEEISLSATLNQPCKIQELLSRAKKIVQQSTPAKSTKQQQPSRQAFLTDVNISEQPTQLCQPFGPEPDNDVMLRDIVRLEVDPLAELRMMISKTNRRLTGYATDTKRLKDTVKEAVDEKRLTFGNGFSQRPSTSYNGRKRPRIS